MGIIYVVHCVDTEGPLYESLSETFERIYRLTGVRVEASEDNLLKVQNMELPLNGMAELASKVFSPRLLNYNSSWTELDRMLANIMSDEFRNKYIDSYGNGWIYNWFIMDWIGFEINPRRRDIGWHNIYDHYNDIYIDDKEQHDELHWHAHPMTTYREAHRAAMTYFNSPHIMESLARRLIDRGYFPSCFRPGFHTERPDSHWLLEQYIPFDFGNQAVCFSENDKQQKDVNSGRYGDWRRAKSDWSWYHPSHDDYQSEGHCNRVIFRCLNVGTRLRLINQDEVNVAFKRASEGEDIIVAFADHDWRDMSYDVQDVYEMLQKASHMYPDVKWKNSGAFEAAKSVLRKSATPIDLEVKLVKNGDNSAVLKVFSEIETFGIQPYLAIKMTDGRYITENFDMDIPYHKWSFTFDLETIHFDDVDKIGVATNSKVGSGNLKVLDNNGYVIKERSW